MNTQTITLKVDNTVSNKFIWLLNHFNKNEIEIIDNDNYISDDEYLNSINGVKESIINASKEDNANYCSRDQLDW